MTVFKNKNLIKAFLEKKIKEEKVEESFGIGKKSYGTKTDTETQSWFRSYTTRIIHNSQSHAASFLIHNAVLNMTLKVTS